MNMSEVSLGDFATPGNSDPVTVDVHLSDVEPDVDEDGVPSKKYPLVAELLTRVVKESVDKVNDTNRKEEEEKKRRYEDSDDDQMDHDSNGDDNVQHLDVDEGLCVSCGGRLEGCSDEEDDTEVDEVCQDCGVRRRDVDDDDTCEASDTAPETSDTAPVKERNDDDDDDDDNDDTREAFDDDTRETSDIGLVKERVDASSVIAVAASCSDGADNMTAPPAQNAPYSDDDDDEDDDGDSFVSTTTHADEDANREPPSPERLI